MVEERYEKVELADDQLDLASLAGQVLGGGGGGNSGAGNLVGGLVSGLLSGGGNNNNQGGGGANSGTNDFLGGLVGGLLTGGGGNRGGGQSGGTGSDLSGIVGGLLSDGKSGSGNIGNIIGGLMGGGGNNNSGGGGGLDAGALIGGISSLIGGGGDRGAHGNGGGANFDAPKQQQQDRGFKGTAVDWLANFIGQAGHKYLGIDANTGRLLVSKAGDAIFGWSGTDNGLGNIGKVVLDRLSTGKYEPETAAYEPMQQATVGGSYAAKPSKSTFHSLREKCLDTKTLFEDPDFVPSDAALFYSKPVPEGVQWLRPFELSESVHPCLFVEGHGAFDVVPGEWGHPAMLTAAAILTMRDELFYRMCPPDQSFTENYAGIFHMQFYQYGQWVDVVVDDRLPVLNGQLMFMHSNSNTHFWSALMEKAYAKLNGGCYECLHGCTTSELLVDLTGGVSEFYDLRLNAPQNLQQMLMRANEMGSLLACSVQNANSDAVNERLPSGLVCGQVYSVTSMKAVTHPEDGPVLLLRIRNPWANEHEWNGDWSDNSSKWDSIDQSVKDELGLKFAHDGESWMSYADFVSNFNKLEVCSLGPEVVKDIERMMGVSIEQTAAWNTAKHDSQWIKGDTAGGCRNNIPSFVRNPQFYMKVTDSDPLDDDKLCTTVVALTQKNRRQLRPQGKGMQAIGFAVYVARESGRLDADFFQYNKAIARCPAFLNLREVVLRCRLPTGTYVVIPSTFDADEEADFQLRVFTTGYLNTKELFEDNMEEPMMMKKAW